MFPAIAPNITRSPNAKNQARLRPSQQVCPTLLAPSRDQCPAYAMPSRRNAKPEKCQALIQCWPKLLSMGLKKVRWSVESHGLPLGPPACLTWSCLPCRFTTGKPSCLTGLEPPAVPGHRWEDLLPAWPEAACCGGTPLGRPPACLT